MESGIQGRSQAEEGCTDQPTEEELAEWAAIVGKP